MKIGVFDSGIGGLSVAKALEAAFPEHEIIFRDDHTNLPYGTKSIETVHQLVRPILKSLANEGCEIIVIACNTVTTTLIPLLRQEIAIPLVGIEPMIKPAAAITKSQIIAVCATPTTLGSQRYHELKNQYGQNLTVIEPDCGRWATMIESNQIDKDEIRETVEDIRQHGADVIVLGCTHYHWIENLIRDYAGIGIEILQPEPFIVERVRSLLTKAE